LALEREGGFAGGHEGSERLEERGGGVSALGVGLRGRGGGVGKEDGHEKHQKSKIKNVEHRTLNIEPACG
jgi:hypothetical protein